MSVQATHVVHILTAVVVVVAQYRAVSVMGTLCKGTTLQAYPALDVGPS